MADTDYTSVYRQFFEEFARTVKPEDPLPIAAPEYNLPEDEMTGEVIGSCLEYLTLKKCPNSLVIPLLKIAVGEIQEELKKNPKNVYEPLKVMQMSTSKINEVCLRYTDNEKLSSLPAPVKEPHVSHYSIKHKRRKMEDRLICLPRLNILYNLPSKTDLNYYGLFDGHCGSSAASFAVTHLHQFLAESPYYATDPVTALRDAYQKTESRYLSKDLKSGTTAVVILHQPDERKLIVSWLGDSQALLVTTDGYLMLVNPHKPGREDELERIQCQNGMVLDVFGVYRVMGQLAVSRAIGDKQFKPYVSAEPDIRVIDLTGKEDFFVIGCDGFWDVVKPREAIEAVYSEMKGKPDNVEAVSKRLVDIAKENHSADNISVIVVFLADPVDISNRSVEATLPRPGGMDADFQTATEKSPFVPLPDQGVVNIKHEENGRHAEFMDELKEYMDYGPETDIDTLDDVLVSPMKRATDPFETDMWKKGTGDIDSPRDLIDGYTTTPQDACNATAEKDMVHFSDSINTFLMDNNSEKCHNQMVAPDVVDVDVDGVNGINDMHMNQINSHSLPDTQNNKFSNYVCNDFADDFAKCDKFAEFNNDLAPSEKETDFTGGEKMALEINVEKCDNNPFVAFGERAFDNRSDVEIVTEAFPVDDVEDRVVCNGSANERLDNFGDDKFDMEKPVSPFPVDATSATPELDDRLDAIDMLPKDTIASDPINEPNLGITNDLHEMIEKSKDEELPAVSPTETCEMVGSSAADSTLNVPQIPSDSDNASQRDADTETPELMSPVVPSVDDKLKDGIVADSGGEVDSEDDEWDFYKVGPGAPANEQIGLVAISHQVAETEKPTMNTQLNPNAAEFYPVSPVATPVEMERKPHTAVPQSVNDVIACSPNWNSMDNVEVPDEVTFLSEIKSRPSNIFPEDNPSAADSEADLGVRDLNESGKNVVDELYKGTVFAGPQENVVSSLEESALQPPVGGIDLATDMTSSFIDTTTMSVDQDEQAKDGFLDMLKQGSETQTTVNVDAPEFKPAFVQESPNKLPDLISPLPVEEEKHLNKENVEEIPPLVLEQEAKPPVVDVPESSAPIVDVTPVAEQIFPDISEPLAVPPQEIQLEKPVEAEVAQVTNEPVKAEENIVATISEPVKSEDTNKIVETPKVPEVVPEAKVEPAKPEVTTGDANNIADVVPVAAAAATAAVAAAVATSPVDKKPEPKKTTTTSKTSPKTTTAKSPATVKSPTAAKTPSTPKTTLPASKPLSAVKKQTAPLASKPTATKPAIGLTSSTANRSGSAKATAAPASRTAATKTATTTTTSAPRPLPTVRRSATATSTVTALKTATAKPLPAKPSTAPLKTATTARVTSSVSAPKPKPRVPSAPMEKKSGDATDSKTTTTTTSRTEVTTTKARPAVTSTATRTAAPRPTSAPTRPAVKMTTTTAMRTAAAAKPKVSSTTTTTTTITRTVLNSKKPLTAAKTTVTKTSSTTSKVNGLANGCIESSTAAAAKKSAAAVKSEIKTETKAEIVSKESVVIETLQGDPAMAVNVMDCGNATLINGIDHD